MSSNTYSSELPFVSVNDEAIINDFAYQFPIRLNGYISFNPFDFLDDKYNSELDANHSRVFSSSKHPYVRIHSLRFSIFNC